jgi:hypothetical protein
MSQLRPSWVNASVPHQDEHDHAEAFEELKEKKILLSLEKDITRGKRNCIVDVKYTMLPTVEFIEEIKRANSRARKLDEMFSSKSDS